MSILDALEGSLLDDKRSIEMDEARQLVDLPPASSPACSTWPTRCAWPGAGEVEVELIAVGQDRRLPGGLPLLLAVGALRRAVQRQRSSTVDQVLAAARETRGSARASSASCSPSAGPTSGCWTSARRAIEAIHAETGLNVACSLGILTRDQARRLADAGVHRYNHNLETAASVLPARSSPPTRGRSAPRPAASSPSSAWSSAAAASSAWGRPGSSASSWPSSCASWGPTRSRSTSSTRGRARRSATAAPLEPHDALRAIALFRLVFPDARSSATPAAAR